MSDAAVAEATPDPRAWLAVAGAVFGTFMALLDISVTNASLPEIQGEIGATGTEGTWIGTGYLVTEIIMIPLTAWFSRLFGLRNFLLISAVLFSAFSAWCGISGSLTMMILGRVGQGFFGGALIPASLTIIAIKLTPRQQPLGLSIYGAAALVAPIIGPVIGGWLTEHASWHWVFFMNLPIAVILVALMWIGIEPEAPDRNELGKADWLGIAGLAAFLGSLTVILEEGQREDWFASPLIEWLAVVSAVGLLTVIAAQLTAPHPVVKLKLLGDRSRGAAFAIVTTLGATSFALVYIIPVFLGTIAGYNAESTGAVTVYLGISTFLMVPAISVMMTHVRLSVSVGLVFFATGLLMNLGVTSDSVGHDFMWPLLVAGIGQPMVGATLSQVATAGLPKHEIADGTALFSMARNLGGSLGLALTGVLLDRRLAFHAAQLGQATTANSAAGQEWIARTATSLSRDGADPAFATLRAMRILAGEVQRQAMVMSYADCFWIMGLGTLFAFPAVLALKNTRPAATVVVH